jgi:hypothetical protein
MQSTSRKNNMHSSILKKVRRCGQPANYRHAGTGNKADDIRSYPWKSAIVYQQQKTVMKKNNAHAEH